MKLELHSTRHGSKAVATLDVDRDYVIGSDTSSDVIIDIEELRPRHAKLLADAQGAFIEPIEGAPVTVNGSRVERRTLLQDGDWLSLGGSPFQIRLRGAAMEPQPATGPGLATPQESLIFGRIPEAAEVPVEGHKLCNRAGGVCRHIRHTRRTASDNPTLPPEPRAMADSGPAKKRISYVVP